MIDHAEFEVLWRESTPEGLADWIDAQISAALEDAANKFDGTTAYNWTAADGYANAFDIASELRYMATEALQEQSK